MERQSIGLEALLSSVFLAVIFFAMPSGAWASAEKDRFIFYSDIYEGYDNNVNLDSSRAGDIFTETDTELGYARSLTDSVNATLDYYLTTQNYHDITDATFYYNNLSLGLDMDMLGQKAGASFVNNVEYNYYPNEEASTYVSYAPEISVKHNFNSKAYQKLSYEFMIREYTDKKAQGASGVNKDSDRRDIRSTLAHELTGMFFRDFFIKVKNEYFVNDSNDQNTDYYDYWSYRVSASVIMPVIGKLYGLAGAGYQRRDYSTRPLVNDRTKTEKDDSYDIFSSLIYDITAKTSLSLNYVYKQSESNEPSQEYSGSTLFAGLHYAF
ncbi:MAG: hypothetical protein HY589_01665 [Candidatus Omnitrophica bacterium]|nr:hypothetical protein [Candidatus Omnitrophota bacterium]